MTEQQQTPISATPASETAAEQAQAEWVTPTFERTPLNEAMNGATTASADATFNLS